MSTTTRAGSSVTGKIDLDAYLDRINYNGKRNDSLDAFREIHLAHVNAIPFENLNPLCGLPVNIDLDSIQQKLIFEQRGGYCFEHNHLLLSVLRELGFQVKTLAARVMWNVPQGVVTARGHMLLMVIINGSHYIADTGFGGLTLPVPILLKKDIVQVTTHEQFRLSEDSGEYFLQANINQEWKNLYRFTLQEHYFPDYEVANYYLSTNPASHFTYNLIAARVENESRLTLRNNEFAIHQNGETRRCKVETTEELLSLLETRFLILLPARENVIGALSKIISGEKR